MTDLAWPHLLNLGLSDLGLLPDTFWNLTPIELMLLAGLGGVPNSLTREGFQDLASRYPDMPRATST